MMPLQRSQDGVEMHLAVNYFVHFLLTNLLLDRPKEAPSARIINVAADIPSWLANLMSTLMTSTVREAITEWGQWCRARRVSYLLRDTSLVYWRIPMSLWTVHVSPGIVRNEFGQYLDYWYGYFQVNFASNVHVCTVYLYMCCVVIRVSYICSHMYKRIDLRMKGSECSLKCIGIAFLHYLTVRHSKEAMKAGMITWERDGVSYLICLPPKKSSFYIQTFPLAYIIALICVILGREEFGTN